MSERNSSMVDSARRAAELRQGKPAPTAAEGEDGLEFEPEDTQAAFTNLSADRQHKLMVVFRYLDGNAKARAYSYLCAADYNPSEGIQLNFSADIVTLTGRNLGPLYNGLCAQRVAVVRQMDPLHADANLPAEATVVTGIEIKPVD
jgi:hypothetical protein